MKINMKDYAKSGLLEDLCAYLGFPPEVTQRLVTHLSQMDLPAFEPHFEKLFSLSAGEEAVSAICKLCETEDDPAGDNGLKALSVYLTAALHTKKLYDGLGISDQIYLETMRGFCRFTHEYKDRYGRYGFDLHFWIYRQLSASLFRLGVLEYEILLLPKYFGDVRVAKLGEPVLSVHIPSDAEMTRQALVESYREARTFFARHFPEFKYKCVCCFTWLLSPALEEMLGPESRIRNFRSDYTITSCECDNNDGAKRVFGENPGDYSKLPEDTSLMRAMKQHLLSGGKISSTSGYIKNFKDL